MEHRIVADVDGVVARVLVELGQSVDAHTLVVEFEEELMTAPIRIANCSGFFGDRLSAAREMVEGGPIDVLTGDWLAELTMLILARQKMKHGNGYARTFMTQMEQVLGTCIDRGIKVVSNAGGLDPQGLGERPGELAGDSRSAVRVGVVAGDDLMPRLGALIGGGRGLRQPRHLRRPSPRSGRDPITANAYLGAEPIASGPARREPTSS